MFRKYLPLLTVLLVVACAPALQVPQTEEISPTSVAEIPVTEEADASTATEIVSSGVEWNRYDNNQLGISFEYPAVYDTPSYQDCGVKVSALPDGTAVSMGYRSILLIQPAPGVGLQEYVDTLIVQKQWMLDSQQNVSLGGEDAIHIDYRFGGSRFGTATVAIHNDSIYAFNFSAGVFCDAPEASVGEGAAYEHWLESFSFTQ